MWIQKRIDVSWSFLFQTLFCPVFAIDRKGLLEKVRKLWSKQYNTFVCLSERTGFDLLLSVLNFPKNSEIIITAINIPHMFNIIEDQGLNIVPIDIDIQTLSPDINVIKRKITSKTKAVIITHLFGAYNDIRPIKELLNNTGILLIEDCAQYFYQLNEDLQSDIRMNSFGTIKTETSLGGAIFTIKDNGLYTRIEEKYSEYGIQKESTYLVKVIKCMFLKILSYRILFGTTNIICKLLRVDIDSILYKATKSFKGKNFYSLIRMQPSTRLLFLLYKQLNSHSVSKTDTHRMLCKEYNRLLDGKYTLPGCKADNHTFWIYALISKEIKDTMAYFRNKGYFLSSQHGIGLYLKGLSEQSNAKNIINNIVYLPIYPEVPVKEKERLIKLLSGEE